MLIQVFFIFSTVVNPLLLKPRLCPRTSYRTKEILANPQEIKICQSATYRSQSALSMSTIEKIPNDDITTSTQQPRLEQLNYHNTTLPPPQTKLQSEFRSMITSFSSHSSYDIARVSNARYRALFSCVVAVAGEPDVYRAFLILFEDLYPLRVAGRMIFKHLAGVMETETRERLEREGDLEFHFSKEEVEMGWRIFEVMSGGKEEISAEMVDSLFSVEYSVEEKELLLRIVFGGKEMRANIDFKTFMMNVYSFVIDSQRDTSSILELISDRMNHLSDYADSEQHHRNDHDLDEKKKKYFERYNHMVETFKVWESHIFPTVNTSNGDANDRMEDVLKGCFVGARNPQVVEALRIVYVDFQGLRIAGDLIFKLMSKLVGVRA